MLYNIYSLTEIESETEPYTTTRVCIFANWIILVDYLLNSNTVIYYSSGL